METISKPLFRKFAAFVLAERDDVAKSAKLVALIRLRRKKLGLPRLSSQTVQDFSLPLNCHCEPATSSAESETGDEAIRCKASLGMIR
jgi:hypothetical protein